MKQVRKCSRKTSLGQAPTEVLQRPGAVHLVGPVDPLEEVGDPPGAALGQGHPEAGNCLSTRDHSRSAAADWMFIGCSVIITSGGESTAGMERRPEDPRWIESTVPVSQHARQTGSQYSSWKLGYPSAAGFSVKLSE